MSYENSVSEHYTHGGLLGAIRDSIVKLGKTIDTITIDDLAPVDEFHIGGRRATDHLLDQVNFSADDHVLDVGCGLGGAARYISSKFNNQVTGIDITQEYIDVGIALCAWVELDKRVSLQHGSALSMPFEDETFDGAVMLHVGMNIDDKPGLFTEVFRVLRPGAYFCVYDIMQLSNEDLIYPVPWATQMSTSILATPHHYLQALKTAGFSSSKENIRRDFALEFFRNMHSRMQTAGGPPPLGLHTLMGESSALKVNNMIHNIEAGRIAPVEIIARKE